MRFLHTSDWHLGKKYQNRDRLEEQKQVLEEILQIANEHQVDAILVAGDIYDQSNPPNQADKLLYQMLPLLSLKGERPVFIIAGNHDSSSKIEAPKYLTQELSIFFVGFNDSLIEIFKNSSGVEVCISDAGFAEFRLPGYNYPLRILFAPYNHIAQIKKDLPDNIPSESFLVRDYFQKRWAELVQKYCDTKGVNLMMAHYTVKQPDDFAPDDYEGENLIGGSYTLYPETFPDGIQYVALGHIHSFTEVSKKPCPIVYSSSPLCYSKKETEVQKYVVIIDIEPNQPAQYFKVSLQTGKKIFFYENVTFDQIEEIIQKNPDHYYEFSVTIQNEMNYQSVKKTLETKYPQIIRIQILKNEMLVLQNFQEWKKFSEKDLFIQYLKQIKQIPFSQEHERVLEEILSFNPIENK